MSQPSSASSSSSLAAQPPAAAAGLSSAPPAPKRKRTVPDLSALYNSHCPAIARALVSVLERSDNAEWVEECLQLLGLESVIDLQLVVSELTTILQHSVDPSGGLRTAPSRSESAPAAATTSSPPAQQQQEQLEPNAAHAASQPLASSAGGAEEWPASPRAVVADADNDEERHEADYDELCARIDLALLDTGQLSTSPSQSTSQQQQEEEVEQQLHRAPEAPPPSPSASRQPANKRARLSPHASRASKQQQQQPSRPPTLLAQLHRLHIDEADAAADVQFAVQSEASSLHLALRVGDADEEMEELRRCGLLS